MVDILSIGSGAVNAYRQALSTTSNNIANVNTPGYSRRELKIGESFPVEEGVFSFGSGAQAEAVGRAYDEFIERALRDATSDLEVNEPVIEYTNRIVDIMGTESVSLANAMDAFFNAAEQLSTDSRSAAYRTEFLNSAEVVAARFNDIALQVDNIAQESEVAFRQSVDELNALSGQLLKVNQQLNRKASILDQPPSMLDQRDAILRDMSALVKLGVTELPSGQVVVNFGGTGRGFEIVTPTQARDIGTFSSDKTGGTDLRLILDPYGAKRPLAGAPGGTIGGAMAFRSEVLRPVRVGLDHLARSLADEANQVHRGGLDAEGDFGGDLFRTSTSFVPSLATANGAVSAWAKVLDPAVAPTEALEFIYREATQSWDVLNLLTRERLGTVGEGEDQAFMGMNITLVGEPENGDVVIFHTENRPARTFEVVIKDIDRVAVAATMRQEPGANNTSGAEASLTIIPDEEQPKGFQYGFGLSNEGTTQTRKDVTIKADGLRPAVQLAKGTLGAQVIFDIQTGSDQQIQVLTREGVHVAGTASLTAAEANALMSLDSGFGEGSYSTTYLNQTGSAAYLDTTVKFGISNSAKTVTNPAVDPDTGLITQVTSTESAFIASKKVSATVNSTAGAKTLVVAGAVNFSNTYYDPDDAAADADGYVEQSIALDALTLAAGETFSAAKMANYLNEEFKGLTANNVVASAYNEVRAQEIDPTKTLTIASGSTPAVTINYAVNATVGEVIQAINAESGQTNVRAEWFGETGIALTNTAGHEGENIILGLVGGGSGLTSLGLVSGNYEGTYQISATGEEVVSNVFSTTNQTLNNGATFDLTVTRSGGGANTVTIAAGSDTPQGIVDAINDAATGIPGITAALLADAAGGHRITLRDTTGVGNAFTVSSDIADYYPNDYAGNPVAAPDTDLGFNDLANRKTGINRPTEISLTLSGTGSPADLGRMALNTGVLIDGAVADDLAIFVTGSGTVNTTLRADAQPPSMPATYPAAAFRVDFSTDSVYTITDTATNTVVATRLFTAGTDIDYQGIRVEFDNVPKAGDRYTIEANTDGLGSNENMLRMIELGRAPLVSGQTFSAAYRDLVMGAGARAQMAELGKEAMTVVRDQAQASRESAVGVNLDEEAADLIRFQQAYQAAAQVIQMSQRLFETLIQAS
jgi:flagellar hook-associated protein FlgK